MAVMMTSVMIYWNNEVSARKMGRLHISKNENNKKITKACSRFKSHVYSRTWYVTLKFPFKFSFVQLYFNTSTSSVIYPNLRQISIQGKMPRDRLFTLAFFCNVSIDVYLITAIQKKVSGKRRSRDPPLNRFSTCDFFASGNIFPLTQFIRCRYETLSA